MERIAAMQFLRESLDLHKLTDWKGSIVQSDKFLGMCIYRDKKIVLSALHVDTFPDWEIRDTILHEIAHALCGPGTGHGEAWKMKASLLGANPKPCSDIGWSPELIDAVRSGDQIEITFEEEVVRKPKYQVTRLQDKCPVCQKVAVTKSEVLIPVLDDTKPDIKMVFLECGHVLDKLIPKGTPFHKLIADEDEHILCVHEWDKNRCVKCGTFQPFQFQLEGMRFIEAALATNKGACIFDEMGLGKTIQALGYVKFHPESWPVLYVVKSGIKFQWYNQILTWLGIEFMGQVIKGSKDMVIPGLRTYIISYDLLIPKVRTSKNGKTIVQGFDPQKLIDAGIKTMILDECQQIKNPDSSRTQQVRKLARHMNVIGLSGSPWKNRGSEFFSILNMIAPLKFPSYQGFIDKWVDFYMDGSFRKMGGIRKPLLFKEYIKDIAIRRERQEVMKELPLVNRTKLPVELEAIEQDEYDAAESEFAKWYNNLVIGGETISAMNMMAQMQRMRHLCGLAKIPATLEFMDEYFENTDRKMVVFAHHRDVQEILYEEFKKRYGSEVPIMQLTGAQNSEDRFRIQQEFNAAPRAFLVASTLAAGEGLNLQTCADCIMHERQWNPANEEQAEGRFIRIGQTSLSVNATYIQQAGSIDSDLDVIVERKRIYIHAAMNKGEMAQWNQSDIIKELADRIVQRVREKAKAA